MKLKDGEVIDYVKFTEPFLDPRFATTQIASEALAPEIKAISTSWNLIDDIKISSEQTAVKVQTPAASEVKLPFEVGSPQPFVLPSKVIADDYRQISTLKRKIQARLDAMTALDEITPEMKATIKAYRWVLEEMYFL